jgi:hypothetical protein
MAQGSFGSHTHRQDEDGASYFVGMLLAQLENLAHLPL